MSVRSSKRFNISIFKMLLISYLITILFPTLWISYTSYQSYSDELYEQKDYAYKEDLQYVNRQIQLLVDSINAFSMQLSLSSELNDAIGSTENTIYRYSTVKNYLNTQVSANNLFYSGYLYMQLSDTVLTTTEGMFRRSEFYDKALLDDILKGKSTLAGYQLRPLQESRTKQVEVFTFARDIPMLNSYPLGQVILNVKKDRLISELQSEQPLKDYLLIFDSNHHVVYQNMGLGNAAAGPFEKLLAQTGDEAQSSRINATEIAGHRYMTQWKTLTGINWTIVRLEPYTVYTEKLGHKLFSIARVEMFVLLIGIALSYLLTVWMYNPWRKMITRLSGYSKEPRDGRQMGSAWVTEAVDGLIRENATVRATIRHYEPIIQDRLVYDLLYGNYSPELNMDDKFRNLQMTFKHSHFLVLIASGEFKEWKDADAYDRKLLVLSYLTDRLGQEFPTLGTVLESFDFGFILNFQEPSINEGMKNKLRGFCRDLNEWVEEELEITMQFSVGGVCGSINGISGSFEQARRVLRYKSGIFHNGTVFYDELPQESDLVFPMAIQKQLLYSIDHHRRDLALQTIEDLFQHYILNNKYPGESLHEMVVQLLLTAKNKLIEDGIALKNVRHIRVSAVFACPNTKKLHRFIEQFIHYVFDALESEQNNKAVHSYITQAMAFIDEQYESNISISDIAAKLGISSSYLSRFFKAEIGKSPLEYLTEYRLAKSKEMLADPKLTLKDISERIGYNDVNSFIRHFKKYEGITPGVYRQDRIG